METPKLIGIVAVIGFFVGALYDYGYFRGLDLNFFTLLSYKDHLEALVLFAVPILIVGFLLSAWRHKSRDWVFGAITAIAVFGFLWRGDLASTHLISPEVVSWLMRWVTFFAIAWLVAGLGERAFSDAFSTSGSSAQTQFGLAAFGVLMLTPVHGYYSEQNDLSGHSFEFSAVLKQGEKDEATRQLHLVRAVEDGFLVVFQEDPQHFVFVPKERVTSLSRLIAN